MVVSVKNTLGKRTTTWPMPLIFAWIFWRWHRQGLSIIAVGMVLITLAMRLLPLFGADSTPAITFGLLVSFLPLYGVLYVLYVPSMCDVGPTDSIHPYPPYLLRAPASSSAMAAWPVLFGMVLLGSYWILCAEFILNPMGYAAPVLWPAVGLAALSACLQAILWAPMSPAVKFLATVAIGAAVFEVTTNIHNPTALLFYMALLGAVGATCAIAALKSTRRGDVYSTDSDWLERILQRPLKRMTSAMEAQRRMEMRSAAGAMPWLILGCVPLTFLVMLAQKTDPLFMLQFYAYGIPYCVLGLPSVGLENCYLMTRPMSSVSLVSAKIYAAVIGASQTVLVSLGMLALWLFPSEHFGQYVPVLGALVMNHGRNPSVNAALSYIAMWVVVIYRLRLDKVSLDLSAGHPIGMVIGPPTIVALILLSYFLPQANFNLVGQPLEAPYWLYVLTVAKASAGLCVLAITLRRGLIGSATLARAATVWVAVAVCLYGIALALLPSGVAAPGTVAAGVFLAMPFARLSAGPILLDLNRHR